MLIFSLWGQWWRIWCYSTFRLLAMVRGC